MQVKVKRLRSGAVLPSRATKGAAGMDLCACIDEKAILLQPMERAMVPTGIAIELPSAQSVALVFARSGQALHQGLALVNGVGVIDADYRGEIGVLMVNLSAKDVSIVNGQRIAQMLVMPVALPQLVDIAQLSETQRGEAGFGSTGV